MLRTRSMNYVSLGREEGKLLQALIGSLRVVSLTPHDCPPLP